jgi:hypothetical protein
MAKFKVGDMVRLALTEGTTDQQYEKWENNYGLKKDVSYRVKASNQYDVQVEAVAKQDKPVKSTQWFDYSYFTMDETWVKERLEKLFG